MVAQQPHPDTLLDPLRTPLKILSPGKTHDLHPFPSQQTIHNTHHNPHTTATPAHNPPPKPPGPADPP